MDPPIQHQRIYHIVGIQEADRGIGFQRHLLHHVPNDMKNFRDATTGTGPGHIVLMGRKTYEGIPSKHRPLKNRINVVLSTTQTEIPGADKVCSSVEDALEWCRRTHPSKIVWVCGGERVYRDTLDHIHEAHITVYHTNQYPTKPADAFYVDIMNDERFACNIDIIDTVSKLHCIQMVRK